MADQTEVERIAAKFVFVKGVQRGSFGRTYHVLALGQQFAVHKKRSLAAYDATLMRTELLKAIEAGYEAGARRMREKAKKMASKLAQDADDRLDHGLSRSVLELCARKIGELKLPKKQRGGSSDAEQG